MQEKREGAPAGRCSPWKGKKSRQRQIPVPRAVRVEDTGLVGAEERKEANGDRDRVRK